MRIWSLHPAYLDPKGLVALWREGLLALKVLKGETKGYRHHPQLHRFRGTSDPVAAIQRYLAYVLEESQTRGYSFNSGKICQVTGMSKISLPEGQLIWEAGHLEQKLNKRGRGRWPLPHPLAPRCLKVHPFLHLVPGGLAPWEIAAHPVGSLSTNRSSHDKETKL